MTPKKYIQSSFINEDTMDNYPLEDFDDNDNICAGNVHGNSDACQGKPSAGS